MAIELNPRFLSRNTPPNLTLIQGDINKVPLPSNTFQVAHARFTLIHTGNVEKRRQRRSRPFAVLTYYEYAPRVKMAAALLDELFRTFPSTDDAWLIWSFYWLLECNIQQAHAQSHQRALKKIIEALRPGGWLVLEEPDFSVARVVTGPKGLGRSVQRVNEAIQHMFSNTGLDPAFGVKLPGLLQEMGLVNLAVENDTPLVQGGSPMATIMKLSAHQLAEKYLATGRVTKTDLTRYIRFAEDPDSWAVYRATVAVVAQKPRKGSTKT